MDTLIFDFETLSQNPIDGVVVSLALLTFSENTMLRNGYSYEELLEVFWFVHDPTQLNRQGNDVGTQYRSVIFYHNEQQKVIAESYKNRLTEEKVWDLPIVTEILPINNFYRAENYHHNYFELNPQNMYCQSVVRPKVEKFRKVFAEKIG
jgi:peptide-methionine (S)-S-oxide reductase